MKLIQIVFILLSAIIIAMAPMNIFTGLICVFYIGSIIALGIYNTRDTISRYYPAHVYDGCIYLGKYKYRNTKYDLYFYPGDATTKANVISKYGINRYAYITKSLTFINSMEFMPRRYRNIPLHEAKARAIKLGLIK